MQRELECLHEYWEIREVVLKYLSVSDDKLIKKGMLTLYSNAMNITLSHKNVEEYNKYFAKYKVLADTDLDLKIKMECAITNNSIMALPYRILYKLKSILS